MNNIPCYPKKFISPKIILYNNKLADFLGINLDENNYDLLSQIFSGQKLFFSEQPYALAYAGHQFGFFVPQLGDGRAHLMGSVQASDGQFYEIQLKGSGPTPFSRGGDGLSPLGPALREYIISESLFHLNVPTTRSLAVVTTGEKVHREQEYLGGIVTRVALSHIRIGSFEYYTNINDLSSLKELVNLTIEKHYPELNIKNSVLELFKSVGFKISKLISKWMSIGFIHGVMNTDNMALSGQTIDFGPCAFMDEFSHSKVFSSIDKNGRYSYENQPSIALWNLSRFAETLIPLMDTTETEAISKLTEALEQIAIQFEKDWLDQMSLKLGIENIEHNNKDLILNFLNMLEKNQLDFTNSFIALFSESYPESPFSIEDICENKEFQEFKNQWDCYLKQKNISSADAFKIAKKVNPLVIPRNHFVEIAIEKAYKNDYSYLEKLVSIIQNPFELKKDAYSWTAPPKSSEKVTKTFCGT
ncbi:MAG: YdiU family protein [Bdellovibrionales bacterium]|nr:YdiU family protein [Bdellovibrionales bacterium]